MTSEHWLRLGALLMALGVAAGAFGAHGLADRISSSDLTIWRTATFYHLLHALALVVLGATDRARTVPATLFAGGILLFSGSLYLLVAGQWRWLGAVTPLGGTAFILGWLSLARSATSRSEG